MSRRLQGPFTMFSSHVSPHAFSSTSFTSKQKPYDRNFFCSSLTSCNSFSIPIPHPPSSTNLRFSSSFSLRICGVDLPSRSNFGRAIYQPPQKLSILDFAWDIIVRRRIGRFSTSVSHLDPKKASSSYLLGRQIVRSEKARTEQAVCAF